VYIQYIYHYFRTNEQTTNILIPDENDTIYSNISNMSAPAKIIQAEAFQDNGGGGGGVGKNNASDLPPFANATAFAPASPSPSPPIMVEVTSPSNLREGYTFDAIHNGRIFPVTVPPGGVKSGQTFQVPFVPNNNNNNVVEVEVEAIAVPYDASLLASETTPMLMKPAPTSQHHQQQQQHHPSSSNNNNNTVFIPTNNAPFGDWSTGLCDCCAEGCCHASFCNSIFFPFILMGQVLTRMKLSWYGSTSIGHEYKRSTCYWILLTLGYIAIRISLHSCPLDTIDIIDSVEDILDDDTVTKNIKKTLEKTNEHCSKNNSETLSTVTTIWFFLTMYVLIKLRSKVRKAYKIRQCCPCEDCFYSIVCSCCTVSQLARQTADYHQDRAYCCTDTGLAEGVVESKQQQNHNQQQQHGACCNHTNPNHHGVGGQHIV
jgi:Cys-rich protein (TIGR01571 family)